MRVSIRRWGNSLALRIPKSLAAESQIDEGREVELSVVRGKLVATPARRQRPTLQRLLSRITPDNLHGEVNTGRRKGREAW